MTESQRNPAPSLKSRYRRLSLRKKLVVIITAVAGIVTIVPMVVSLSIELKVFRDRIIEEYVNTARLVAFNLEPSVGFRDEYDANDILSVLSQREHIETAAVYLNDGSTLAKYRRHDVGAETLPPAKNELTLIDDGYIVVAEPINLKGREQGRLVFRAELKELRSFALTRILLFLGLLAASLSAAIILAKRLGNHLSKPIIELADTAQRITVDHDFSTRHNRLTDDETGRLVDAFNEMMAAIESSSEQLVLARDTAEASSRAKDDFLSVISHELRTPLNPIIGYVEILLRKSKEAEDRKQLGLVRQYAEHLQKLIDQVIDYSRFERGAVSLNVEGVDYQRLCQNVVNLLQQQAQKNGIELTCEHGSDGRSGPFPSTIDTDRVKLQQVVLNLVANALKFTKRGSITIRTSIKPDDLGKNRLRIEVEDTGIGIDKANRDIVFKPFSQIDVSLTRQYSGMGLGLAITQKIVDAMEGEIDFTSEPSKGSVFWFEIPAHFSSEPEPDPSSESSVHPTTSKRSGTVLLVDDQLVNLELGESMLQSSGNEVVCARSGIEAVELARKQRFDLIILDIKMPKMNGYETASALRTLEKELDRERTPIIALTAHVTTKGNEHCFESGMDDFLPKPFNTERLNLIIRKWLDSE